MRWLFVLSAVLLARPAAADEPSFNGRPLPEWLAMLKDDPLPRKRRAAAVALGQIASDSPDSRPVVLPALGRAVRNDSSPPVRAVAANTLGQHTGEKPELFFLDTVEALRIEKESEVRRELAVCLGRLGARAAPAVQPLTAVLTDSDPTTRAAAAEALGRIGAEARTAAPVVAKLAADADRRVRRASAFALGRINPEDRPAAAAAVAQVLALERGDDSRLAAVAAVGSAGLWSNARDTDAVQTAVVALGLLAVPNAANVSALADRLTDPDAEVRKLTALALVKFGPAVKEAEPKLADTVRRDPDRFVRIYALQALSAGYAADPKPLLPLLAERLKADADFEVRIAVAVEIGGFGRAATDASPALREAQRDPQLKVREAATAALRQVTKPPEPSKP